MLYFYMQYTMYDQLLQIGKYSRTLQKLKISKSVLMAQVIPETDYMFENCECKTWQNILWCAFTESNSAIFLCFFFFFFFFDFLFNENQFSLKRVKKNKRSRLLTRRPGE